MMTPYLRRLAVTVVATLTAVGAFNLLIDPSGIWGLVARQGFNVPKARPDRDIAQRKLWLAAEQRPDAVILGNSRAEIGFDPGHPAWKTHASRPFNLAVPGQGLEDAVPVFEALCREQPPRVVLVGLDFVDFLSASVAPPRSADTFTPRLHPTAADRLMSLFTAEALVESIRTLRAQRQQYPEVITPAGFNPLLDYIAIAKSSGYHALFQQRLLENARVYAQLAKRAQGRSLERSSAVDALRRLMDASSRCGSELVLVTYPYHSQLLVLFGEAGLWNAFEDWKRLLVGVVEEERRKHPGLRLQLVDFAYFSNASMEPIPAPPDRRTEVLWYWEAGHFKSALGNVVLESVLGQGSDAGQPLRAVALAPGDIDAWLAQVRGQDAAFRRANPDAVRSVREAFAGSSVASVTNCPACNSERQGGQL